MGIRLPVRGPLTPMMTFATRYALPMKESGMLPPGMNVLMRDLRITK